MPFHAKHFPYVRKAFSLVMADFRFHFLDDRYSMYLYTRKNLTTCDKSVNIEIN